MTKSIRTPVPKFSKQFTQDKPTSNGRPFAIELTNSGAKSQKSGATAMTNLQLRPNIQIINNQPMASSLDVAKFFGKDHDKVMRSIDTLKKQEPDFCTANFGETIHLVAQPKGGTRDESAYIMSRDGFMFVVMGFTGEKARKTKIAYINKFNEMEASLKQVGHVPSLPANIPLLPMDVPLADLDLTEIHKMIKDDPWTKVELVDDKFMISSKTVADRCHCTHKSILRFILSKAVFYKKYFKGVGGTYNDPYANYPNYPDYFYMTKEGFWLVTEIIINSKGRRTMIAQILEQFDKLESTLTELKRETLERLRVAEIERLKALPVPAPEPKPEKAKLVPADPWSSAEKDCENAFKEYLKAGGILYNGDDFAKGLTRSIGMLLTFSFKLQADLWAHRKFKLEAKKLISCNN